MESFSTILKSFTPMEIANVLQTNIDFYGGYKYSKMRKDRVIKQELLAKFRRDP